MNPFELKKRKDNVDADSRRERVLHRGKIEQGQREMRHIEDRCASHETRTKGNHNKMSKVNTGLPSFEDRQE